MEFLSQSFRIGISLVAFVAGGVLLAPTQPTLLTARTTPEPEQTAALDVPGPAPRASAAAETEPAVETAPAAEAEPDMAAAPEVRAPVPQTSEESEPVAVADAPTDDAVEPAADAPADLLPPPADDVPPVDTAEAVEDELIGPSSETTASIETEVAALPEPEVEPEPAAPQPLGLAELTAEPPPLDFRLYREPEVAEATTLRAAGSSIQIAGVEPVPADAACADGAQCGAEAREAVDEFLRGRAVICSVPIGRENNVTAPCLVGEEDIGEWIVANGWAPASAGSRYKDAEEAARAEGLGIWANGGVTVGD